MKLRPYHNPENIDESLVPDGWRFRYADEMPSFPEENCPCLLWMPHYNGWSDSMADGTMPHWTYIVPVKS
jgi:hypothetical protein